MQPEVAELSSKSTTRSLAHEQILTTKDLMQLFRVKHRSTIYNLINEGMPVIKFGKDYRYITQEVIAFLRERTKINGKRARKKRKSRNLNDQDASSRNESDKNFVD